MTDQERIKQLELELKNVIFALETTAMLGILPRATSIELMKYVDQARKVLES